MRLRLAAYTLVAFCGFLALAADDPPPEVEVEPVQGEKVTGLLLNPVVRIKTEYGTQEVERRFVHRVTFSPGDAQGGHDTVELKDHTTIRGTVVSDEVQVQAGETIHRFGPSGLREIKATAKKQLGLGALILGLVTLTAMEIVLGIDNIIFLAIVAGKLPEDQQPKARRLGLMAALGTRVLLLFSLSLLLGLTKPIFTVPDLPLLHDLEAREVSLRDLILLAGGLFLIWKSVKEMHEKLEEAKRAHESLAAPRKTATFGAVLVQIAILDIVFSLDSVITAVGMVDELWVMIVAMVIAMGVMMVFAGSISNFVSKHPTLKILALAFLILIGVMLVAEAAGQHMNKGYIYFAMAFAVGIEMINLRLRRHSKAAPAGPAVGSP
ncbi:MAG TPA: TerC family protein [Gemmataceae bacterium]|jgi:predicted tellurium resistance membrane protein TerC|nr:TerC family protein [Gemmataceae bacterium]